jgi:4-hydroxy-2-oxoheptanedioate aldolase
MDTPVNRVKAAMAAGETTIGLWLASASPMLAEIGVAAGYDWCLIDGEHGPSDIPLMLAQAQAMSGGPASIIARVPVGDRHLIKQVLDLDIQTIMVPMVDSAAQAADMAAAVRYPPRGTRGVGALQSRASGYGLRGRYVHEAHDQTCLIVQLESRSALDAVDAIAAVDGVDCVFVGPADLAASMGHAGIADVPEVDEAIAHAFDRIHAAGKAIGILAFDTERAARYARMGATFVAVAGDIHCYAAAVRARSGDVRRAIEAAH